MRPKGAGSANYAADYVMDVLDDFVGTVESDIVVSTTIEPAMQAAAERVLVDELNAKGQKFNVSQGAFVAMQPDGAVKALVGGRNYETSQFNRATAARRQPGSSFKPFVYLTAMERGYTPDTVREDAPGQLQGLGAGELRPRAIAGRSPCAMRSRSRSTPSRSSSTWRSARRPWCRRRSASASPRRSRPTARSRSAPPR